MCVESCKANGMAEGRKSKRKGRSRQPPPRDPFWRLRRLFGEKRKGSAKIYRRADAKKTERQARGDAD